MTNVFVRFIVFSLKTVWREVYLLPTSCKQVHSQAFDLFFNVDESFYGTRVHMVTNSCNFYNQLFCSQQVMRMGLCTSWVVFLTA